MMKRLSLGAAKPAGLAQPATALIEESSVPCGVDMAAATASARLACR